MLYLGPEKGSCHDETLVRALHILWQHEQAGTLAALVDRRSVKDMWEKYRREMFEIERSFTAVKGQL